MLSLGALGKRFLPEGAHLTREQMPKHVELVLGFQEGLEGLQGTWLGNSSPVSSELQSLLEKMQWCLLMRFCRLQGYPGLTAPVNSGT